MRSILIVVGVVIAALIISLLVQPSKQLVADPQEAIAEKQEAEQRAEAAKAARAKSERAASVDKAFNPPREGAVTIVMTVANRGDVTMELYPKAAPKTTARVVELARQGFYNGIRFHRVVDGFVVQAGDPKSKTDGVDVPYIGRSGSGKTIPFEKNNLPHVPGAVAMALNAPASDTADSQFFIDLADNATLNGDYCVFGKVTQGMDVVRSIKKGDAITSMTVQ